MAWQAESITFVLQGPIGQLEPYPLFQELTGSTPRALSPTPDNRVTIATGSYDQYELQVIGRSNRVDLNVVVPPADERLGLIDDPLHALGQLEGLAQTVIQKTPATRLSYVTTLALVAGTADEAAEHFYEKVNVPRVDAAPLDLVFQYNRAMTTKDGLTLNRLHTWSVANVQIASMELGLSPVPLRRIDYFALNLRLDVNIPVQTTPVETSQATSIATELADQTKMLISEAS